MTVNVIRVVLQQRQRLFREGLALLLAEQPDIEVVATAVTGDDLYDRCIADPPDLALLEVELDDPCRLMSRLRRDLPELRFVGTHRASCDASVLERVRRAGLRQLVSREEGLDGCLWALREAVRLPSQPITVPPLRPYLRPLLTEREASVLRLVGAGCTSREISSRLSITHKTVENHKQRIFAKLGVQNQAHAVGVAIRAGLIGPDGVFDLSNESLR